MLRLTPQPSLREVLCLGAHSDDIEIGCGGTVLRLIRENPDVHVTWVVLSAIEGRVAEARASAAAFLAGAKEVDVHVLDFPDRFFPYEGASIKRWFDKLGSSCTPDLVLTHRRADVHQDHRVVADFTWNTFRDQLILEYEIPKWEGDLGQPNLYVPLDQSDVERKVDLLMTHFPSQLDRYWFTPETFRAMLRLRGVEARAASGSAEAFHATKVVV